MHTHMVSNPESSFQGQLVEIQKRERIVAVQGSRKPTSYHGVIIAFVVLWLLHLLRTKDRVDRTSIVLCKH